MQAIPMKDPAIVKGTGNKFELDNVEFNVVLVSLVVVLVVLGVGE